MSKLALITGITGQDGSYLSELLLKKDYKVFGIVRRTSLLYSTTRLDSFRSKLHLFYGDLTDCFSLSNILGKVIKEGGDFSTLEIYNLAAQSHVKISFELPDYTSKVDGLGVLHLLELIRQLPEKTRNKVKFYQAGTSEMFGKVLEIPQKESTQFNPCSPYACAKVYAHYIVKTYREAYDLFACNGILFNHESPRRGHNFVTMKIINGVKRLSEGKSQEPLRLGNLDSLRDWGHAKDYVEGMWLMLQHDTPDDYILATGKQTSVREFVNKVFSYVGIKIVWEGKGLKEVGKNKEGRVLVVVDPKYFRPCEVDTLLGDPSKAYSILGWAHTMDLDAIIADMME